MEDPQFTWQEIEIPATVKLPAEICGGLAFHQAITRDGTWTVTHIASAQAVADHLDDQATARRVITALLELDIDWSQGGEQLKPIGDAAISPPRKRRK